MLYTLLINNTTLADGSTSICESLVINGQQLVDESEPIRAAHKLFFDRGNKSTHLEARIATEHASIHEMLDFTLRRIENVPGVAALTIQLTEGGVTYSAVASSAKWTPVRSQQIGFTSVVTYAIEAGAITFTYTGAGSDPFTLPIVQESGIDPLTIPAGTVAAVNSGELLAVRSLQVDGELDIGSELYLIAD